jgi:hypothetical protein
VLPSDPRGSPHGHQAGREQAHGQRLTILVIVEPAVMVASHVAQAT